MKEKIKCEWCQKEHEADLTDRDKDMIYYNFCSKECFDKHSDRNSKMDRLQDLLS